MCDDVNANKSLNGNERETPSIRSRLTHGFKILRRHGGWPGLPSRAGCRRGPGRPSRAEAPVAGQAPVAGPGVCRGPRRLSRRASVAGGDDKREVNLALIAI